MMRSLKVFSGLAMLLYLIAGIVIIYVALAGLVIRENLTFIVYGSAVAAIGVAHVPVILHPYHRRGYLPFLALLAAMLGLLSLFFAQPYGAIALAVVPGAIMSVITYLRSRKAREPS